MVEEMFMRFHQIMPMEMQMILVGGIILLDMVQQMVVTGWLVLEWLHLVELLMIG